MFFGHIFQKAKTTKKEFICFTRITQGKPAGSTEPNDYLIISNSH
jgi:hypothetical protein